MSIRVLPGIGVYLDSSPLRDSSRLSDSEPPLKRLFWRVANGVLCASYDGATSVRIYLPNSSDEDLMKVVGEYQKEDFKVELTEKSLFVDWTDSTYPKDVFDLISLIEREVEERKKRGLNNLDFIMENFCKEKPYRVAFRQKANEVIEHFTKNGILIRWTAMGDFCCGMDLCIQPHWGYQLKW